MKVYPYFFCQISGQVPVKAGVELSGEVALHVISSIWTLNSIKHVSSFKKKCKAYHYISIFDEDFRPSGPLSFVLVLLSVP